MTTYISILRGINVGGHRIIKMDALRKMCLEMKFIDVQTYLQSGNIIFKSDRDDVEKINQEIKNNIQNLFGFDVPVITLTKIQLTEDVKQNPFPEKFPGQSDFFHVTFLSDIPSAENLEKINQVPLPHDAYETGEKVIYLFCPKGYSKTKLTNGLLESKLRLTATTRNWKTVLWLEENS